MVNVTYPGVYIEEVPSGVRPIEGASTSTAAFIGEAMTGATAEPTLIFKWADYRELFCPMLKFENKLAEMEEELAKAAKEDKAAIEAQIQTHLAARPSQPNAMWLAVRAFFMNGGGAAYIVNTTTEYEKALASLKKIRDVSIICLPGKTYGGLETKTTKAKEEGIIDDAISHADDMQNRMVIVDLDEGVKLTTNTSVTNLGLPKSSFAVAYYPWVEVANPFYNPEDEEEGGSATLKVAPSGFVAGMWAKTDGRRGVWKAPAGVETSLLGVAGLADDVDDNLQGQLNPVSMNCLRKIPGAGPVIWGTRTLGTKEWLYVPVRRTANMIRESIYNNIQWAVFEPNDHRLWSSLRVNIDAFMNGLWRAGAFQGEKASEAYFVRCNLGDTMTQGDIDTGKVIVEVGFAPLKPAEFVIVRIQQKVAQQ